MARVLLVAEACNPEWASIPLEGWSHSAALARIAQVHLVTQIRNRDAILRAGLSEGRDFTAIDSERILRPLFSVSRVLGANGGRGWTMYSAFYGLGYYYFERLVWKQFAARIKAGEFDIVHRITPLSPTMPSLLAPKCRRLGIPFVLGPLNGGVPWPREFDKARRKEREWLSYVRGLHRLMPGTRSTRKNANALIIGSRDTWRQYCPKYEHKCVYIPENAIDPSRFPEPEPRAPSVPLKAVFLGRLVPYKGADMAIEACAPQVRQGRLTLTVVGDGPERGRLETLVRELGLGGRVHFAGWVSQDQVHRHLGDADLFIFPSIREFGGAVVLEAMAMGAVPVVVEYGGPAELVTSDTGYLIPLGSRTQIISCMQETLHRIVSAPEALENRRHNAVRRARTQFTWQAKAQQVLEVYRWVLGQRLDRPAFGMPLPDVASAEATACAV